MAYTRAQVRDLVRQRCDLENTTAQQDTELNNHINDAVVYVHDFLIATLGSRYGAKIANLTATANFDEVSLSAVTDYYSLISLKLVFDDLRLPLSTYNLETDITTSTARAWGPGDLPRYSVQISPSSDPIIRIDPKPASNQTLQLTYHITAPVYTDDGNTVAIPFVDLLVMEACIRVKDKEERDASRFMQERELIKKRIEDWAAQDRMTPPVTQYMPRAGHTPWRPRGRIF